MVKIYTRTGDGGDTGLFGGGRVSKADARLEAYGTLDELNAYLGWFRSATRERDLADLVRAIQPVLFDLGAHLATPAEAEKARGILPPIREESVARLEEAIDRLETELPPLTAFILPGGSVTGSILQVARAVCRRAERAVVRAIEDHGATLPPSGLPYLNRLSDLLFVMARVAVRREGGEEAAWVPERPGA